MAKDDQTEVSVVLGVGLDCVTPDGTIMIDGVPGTITGLGQLIQGYMDSPHSVQKLQSVVYRSPVNPWL